MEKDAPPAYSPPGVAPPPAVAPPPGVAPSPGFAPHPGFATTSGAAYSAVLLPPPPPAVFGPNAQIVRCPSCHTQVTTKVETEPSTKTHIIAVLLCSLWCCCLPYFIDSCQNRNHYCPSCGAYLGAYKN